MAYAAGHRQHTRPESRALACAQTQTTRGPAHKRPSCHTREDALNTRSGTRCLSSVLTHASSLSKSNTRTFAHAAGHRQRTRLESCTLSCVRTQCCRKRGLTRDSSRVHTCAAVRTTRPSTLCPTSERTHASSLLEVERTVAHATGQQQRTRPESRALASAQTQTLPRARPRARMPSLPYTRRRAHHTPWHVVSNERADSCNVALLVERTVARAADHRQRTRPESRTLTCVRTQRCRSCCLRGSRASALAVTCA